MLAVAAEAGGAVWLGTWAGGVTRFDPRTNSFTTFTSKNSNLPDDNIFGMHVDRQNRVWIGSWREGLLLFDRASRSFTKFPIAAPGVDGLRDLGHHGAAATDDSRSARASRG